MGATRKIYVSSADEYVTVIFSENCVTIPLSHRWTTRKEQTPVCKAIIADSECPECVRKRGWYSLRCEWRAHNFLFELGLLKSHTCAVDLDCEKWYRRVLYWLLSL